MMDEKYFEYIKPMPDLSIQRRTERLIGFDARYDAIYRNLRLILNRRELDEWSQAQHSRSLPLVALVADRHPLMILEGDVGTGKTVTAEGIADRMTRDLRKEGVLIKLSTRVRGQGLHGEMSKLIHEGFTRLVEEAGKRRLAFLLIDEADAIASRRSMEQMHQEEKAAVNTMIQRLDDLRNAGGRAVVLLTTNRVDALDPAIVRRASLQLTFCRPTVGERRLLIEADLEGVGLSAPQLDELVQLTGPDANDGVGFTFSDLRQRFICDAVARVFPDRPLTMTELRQSATEVIPSPVIE